MTYPKAFNHIGLSVPDVEAAFKWYTEVLGFYPIMKPTKINTVKRYGRRVGWNNPGLGVGDSLIAVSPRYPL